jgi:hypothetical protein
VVRQAVAFQEALFPGGVEEKKRTEVAVLDRTKWGEKGEKKEDTARKTICLCELGPLFFPFSFFSFWGPL